MIDLSDGQRLALQQLANIVARSDGALQLIGEPRSGDAGAIWMQLSLEMAPYRQAGGLAFRDRERFLLYIASAFPFKPPRLYFFHKRFVGTPHVQWGQSICLYQSVETEYNPSDGMFGFFERVRLWMSAAGRGDLDPEAAPLHPPVAYVSSSIPIVVRADTPVRVDATELWVGRVEIQRRGELRRDIVDWTALEDWETRPSTESAGAIIFPCPLVMEFPSKVKDLMALLENAGLKFQTLYTLLRLLALQAVEGEPNFLVLGAPMRRRGAGEPLRPHLTVWEIEASALATLRAMILSNGADAVAKDELVHWMVEAEVRWCEVFEDRPEIVNRRDRCSTLSEVAQKKILLLGCGALGSAVADSVVRAGAARIHLVDNGTVKPGILVRQRFADSDIGQPKVMALKARLDGLGLSTAISAEALDLSSASLPNLADGFDLVIDATASSRVTHRLESELKEYSLSAPLISMAVSAKAQHGSVTVRMPEYSAGPHGLMRQAKLEAFAGNRTHSAVRAFWPHPSEVEVFQPEPGCSAPTFVGSAADMDHLAAGLLNLGLRRIQELHAVEGSLDLITVPWMDHAPLEPEHLFFRFEGYRPLNEAINGYQVWQSPRALRDMETERRRNTRVRSDRVETGGLIFGEIDDAHKFVWVDSVTGPPPDSEQSAERFLCGVAGTKASAAHHDKATGGSSRFMGIWHTHPVSRGTPSQDDLTATAQLLHFQEFPPRHVVMLIVGHAATTPELNYYLFQRDNVVLVPFEGSDVHA